MNRSKASGILHLEQQIRQQGGPCRIDDLVHFPFKSHGELVQSQLRGEVSFGSVYDSDILDIFGTKSEIRAHRFWLSLPIIIVITNITLAVVYKEWILLLGVVSTLIGFFGSSPNNPLKGAISGLGMIAFIGSFFVLEWTWSVIIGSMVFSQIFAMTAREQQRSVLQDRALESEILFCYLFKNKYLSIKNTKTNRVLVS